MTSPQSQPAEVEPADQDIEMEDEEGDDVTGAVTVEDRQARNCRKRSRNACTGDDRMTPDESRSPQADASNVEGVHVDDAEPPAAKRPRKSKKTADKGPTNSQPPPTRPRKKGAVAKVTKVPEASYADLPDNAPSWVKNKVWPFFTRSEDMPHGYKTLVNAWLDLEVTDNFAGEDYLGGSGRPKAVTEWIAAGRRPTYDTSHVGGFNIYEASFWKWWAMVQPEYRREHRRDDAVKSLLQVPPPSSIPNPWHAIDTTGINGLTNAVAALTFWARKIYEQPASDYRSKQARTKLEGRLSLAVADVQFVLDNVRAVHG
jgi:hypothetical protein